MCGKKSVCVWTMRVYGHIAIGVRGEYRGLDEDAPTPHYGHFFFNIL